MLRPPRSPQRYPPPPSPSKSLAGMEQAVPPRTRSSSRSPFSSDTDLNKPLPPPTRSPSRSPFSPAADRDKPLPQRPRKGSSVYSSDSGYTRIIETYSDHSREEEPPVPLLVQPTAYQETISALLRRRLDDPPSPKSVPSEISVATLASQILPYTHHGAPASPTLSAISAPSVADSRNAPSFKDFSRDLRNRRINAAQAASPPNISPLTSPDFRAVSYASTRQSLNTSPRTSDIVDMDLVPAPLAVKNRSTVIQDRQQLHNVVPAKDEEQEERSQSRFSHTSSEESYVIYTGVLDSVRAYVRHKLQKKGDTSKKERKRVMSVASTKYPGMMTAKEYDRRRSSESRKGSIQEGMASVYDKISKLSISGPSGQSKEDKEEPRGRKKQLAIPTSEYQKYGAAVWQAPKGQKMSKRESALAKRMAEDYHHSGDARKPARHASLSARPAEVVGAFKSGRNLMIHALDDTKHKLQRSNSEKRRDTLKQSIRLVGPADEISDGVVTYHV